MSKITINVLTGKSEVDPDYIAPSFPEPIEDKRAEAVMDRGPFCQQLRRLNILPSAEAVQAARGEWPASFASFTAGMSADEAADMEIEWAGASVIRYSTPSLQSLALHNANGDQAAATVLLDQIFGITP